MSQAIIARDRDADKIPANIKDGVEIDGVVGDYVGGLINVNLKPVHYKGTAQTGGLMATIGFYGNATMVSGSHVWFFGCILSPSVRQLWALDLDTQTGMVTEYVYNWNNENTSDVYPPFRMQGDTIYFDWRNGVDNYTAYIDTSNTAGWQHGGRTTLGVAMTNSETLGGNTFEARQYGLESNDYTLNRINYWYPGFYIT